MYVKLTDVVLFSSYKKFLRVVLDCKLLHFICRQLVFDCIYLFCLLHKVIVIFV